MVLSKIFMVALLSAALFGGGGAHSSTNHSENSPEDEATGTSENAGSKSSNVTGASGAPPQDTDAQWSEQTTPVTMQEETFVSRSNAADSDLNWTLETDTSNETSGDTANPGSPINSPTDLPLDSDKNWQAPSA